MHYRKYISDNCCYLEENDFIGRRLKDCNCPGLTISMTSHRLPRRPTPLWCVVARLISKADSRLWTDEYFVLRIISGEVGVVGKEKGAAVPSNIDVSDASRIILVASGLNMKDLYLLLRWEKAHSARSPRITTISMLFRSHRLTLTWSCVRPTSCPVLSTSNRRLSPNPKGSAPAHHHRSVLHKLFQAAIHSQARRDYLNRRQHPI